jgi:hypothetical protein
MLDPYAKRQSRTPADPLMQVLCFLFAQASRFICPDLITESYHLFLILVMPMKPVMMLLWFPSRILTGIRLLVIEPLDKSEIPGRYKSSKTRPDPVNVMVAWECPRGDSGAKASGWVERASCIVHSYDIVNEMPKYVQSES